MTFYSQISRLSAATLRRSSRVARHVCDVLSRAIGGSAAERGSSHASQPPPVRGWQGWGSVNSPCDSVVSAATGARTAPLAAWRGARTTTICRDPCGGRASRALHDTGAAKSLDGEVRCCAVDSLNSRFRASRRQLLGFVTSQVDANWPARSASGLLVTRRVVSNGTRSALPTMRIAAAGDA